MKRNLCVMIALLHAKRSHNVSRKLFYESDNYHLTYVNIRNPYYRIFLAGETNLELLICAPFLGVKHFMLELRSYPRKRVLGILLGFWKLQQ